MSINTANERVAQIAAHLEKVGPSLQDKVCIVTGAGSLYGIGYSMTQQTFLYLFFLSLSLSRATVYALAKRGPKAIFATDLQLDNDLQELAKDIQAKYPGVQCLARAVDAASTAAVTGVINEALDKFGRLDVFFANAGIATGTLLEAEDEESFMHVMRVNALRQVLSIIPNQQAI